MQNNKHHREKKEEEVAISWTFNATVTAEIYVTDSVPWIFADTVTLTILGIPVSKKKFCNFTDFCFQCAQWLSGPDFGSRVDRVSLIEIAAHDNTTTD